MKPEARLLIARRCSWGTLFLVTRGPSRVEHVLPAPGAEPAEAVQLVRGQGFSRELRAAHPQGVAEALGLPHVEPWKLLGPCTGCVEALAETLCAELGRILSPGKHAGPRVKEGPGDPPGSPGLTRSGGDR